MNQSFSRYAPVLLAVALAAGSGVALTSLAQAQTSAAPAPMQRPPMERGGHGMRGRHMMKEVERLKTSLQLSPSQAALWDRAVAAMKPPADMRDRMMARRDRLAAMLDDPAFDPRRFAADMDSADAERRAAMTNVRNAWFAVYDSLTPVQRGQAREFLRSRLSHGGMEGRMGWRHREHGGEGPPMPPMPSTAR